MPLMVPFHQATSCMKQSLPCFKAVDWPISFDWFDDVDWYEELRLITTSVLLAGILVPTAIITFNKISASPLPNLLLHHWTRISNSIIPPSWIRLSERIQKALGIRSLDPDHSQQARTCQPKRHHHYQPPTFHRTMITTNHLSIYAYPSKGGLIILSNASRPDLDFLALDPFNLPQTRHLDQEAEDALSQRLLLLGAKWWDSESRSQFITDLNNDDNQAIDAIMTGKAQPPTRREQRWVSVAWPETGGVWVAEYDTGVWTDFEDDECLPSDTGFLSLAINMDERSRMLRERFGARFYPDLKDYEGFSFLKSWDWKVGGEVGPLEPVRLVG